MKFSKEYQPKGKKGRPKVDNKKVQMSVSVLEETKEWYNQHRGLSGKVLEDYKRAHDEKGKDGKDDK